MVASTETFATRLASVIAETGSLLCLGLDPDGMADAAAAERQCHQLLEATLDKVCAVKPNLAFFEQFGSAGYAVWSGCARQFRPIACSSSTASAATSPAP